MQADAADLRLHALGVVQGHEGDQGLKVRFKLSGDAQAGDDRGSSRVKAMLTALTKVDSQWWVLKLSSLSTIMREWAAVHSIAHTPLRDVLLTAKVGAPRAPGRIAPCFRLLSVPFAALP